MSISGSSFSSAGDAAAQAPATQPEVHRFRFPLPIDPARLLAGVLTRWPWLLVGMVVFGTLGAIVGKAITHPTYSLSVALIKRRVPQTVQTSEIGQSFRPADLNDATLLATLLASEPRDIAFERAANGISPDRAGSLVEASQLENTDIFYVTYHSPISAEDAIRVSGIWAEEICEYTKRLQQSEARSVLAILVKEVAGLEKKIEDTNAEILDFAKSKDFIGGESQVAAALGKLSQIELKLEDARAGQKALRDQLAELDEKIRRHSPLNLRLRAAREELADLRSTYTDDNPLVQTKLESITYLEQQIAELGEGKGVDLESFTGTPLGNQIYLDIIDVRNRLTEAENHIRALEEQRTTTAARLSEFPAIITQYDALRAERDSSISELSLMSKRLKEAEIFASGSPGYWQIFQPPDARKVVSSSLTQKPALLGAAGAGAGAALAVLITLLRTHRTTHRSVLECCATTHAPLAALLPAHPGQPSGISNLWIAILSPALAESNKPILIWTAALEPADERMFWEELAATAADDTGNPLGVGDLTPDDLWPTPPESKTLHWMTHDPAAPMTIVRASELPHMTERETLATVHRWYAVVRSEKSSLKTYSASRHLTEVYLAPCSGTIVLSEPVSGRLRSLADQFSLFLTKRFS